MKNYEFKIEKEDDGDVSITAKVTKQKLVEYETGLSFKIDLDSIKRKLAKKVKSGHLPLKEKDNALVTP